MKLLVSIIIPCYNQAHFLEECLQSVLKQTYENWECIIVNDGSPDNTEEIAQKWVKKDHRFKYVFKENGGLSSARNAGIKVSQGDYIQFLDADDLLLPNKLQKSLEILLNKNASVVVTNFQLTYSKNGKTNFEKPYCTLSKEILNKKSILLYWDENFSIPIHCGMFRKNSNQLILFNENLKAKEDWFFWIEYAQSCPNESCFFLDEPLAIYRKHPQSMTKNGPHMLNNIINVHFELKNILSESDYQLLLEHKLAYYIKRTHHFKSEKLKLEQTIVFKWQKFLQKVLKKIRLT
jgi:glycosyltransferase involved in cell wall biosynthesis